MSIAVTGSSGFVGSAFSRLLAERGVCHLALPVFGNFPLVSTVVHLAARVHVMNDQAADPLTEFRNANVVATALLARRAAKAGVRRFVFISSVKVNGEVTKAGAAFTEMDEVNPLDAYAVSKCEAEQALRQIAAETGMDVVIIRPPLVYGPGVKANFASLLRAVAKGWPIPVGNIYNLRSFVGLDNLVDFIYCCSNHPSAANQTFLVSDGVDVSTAQLVKELAAAIGVQPNLWSVPQWGLKLGGALLGKHAEIQRMCGNLQVDISKSRALLGWQPPISLQEGLRRASVGVKIS